MSRYLDLKLGAFYIYSIRVNQVAKSQVSALGSELRCTFGAVSFFLPLLLLSRPITIIHELSIIVTSTCQALEACHGALEAGVVVEGDLRHDVVRPVVLVEVIGGRRSSNQGSVQLVRVVLAGVTEGSPGALSRRGSTSCCLGEKNFLLSKTPLTLRL